MFDIDNELRNLPEKPGVYIMQDANNNVLYVGKALNLKNRVRQYFQHSAKLSPRIKAMISAVAKFEYIVTNSELEALILECNMIKAHKPKFNILLKDDKSYPYIKITVNELYPRIFMTRKVVKDGAKYFGPYPDVNAVKDTLSLLKKIFPLKLCKKDLPKDIGKGRPCLNFEIHQCLAPCQGGVNVEDYNQMVKEVCKFLDGKQNEIIGKLEKEMQKASENMEFEKAAVIRDRIFAARKLAEKQKVIEIAGHDRDMDVIGFVRGNLNVCFQLFFVRNGKVVGRKSFILKDVKDVTDCEIMASFLKQFYNQDVHIPKQILLGICIEERKVIQEWLTGKRGSKVELKLPKKGYNKKLLEMAQKNAELELQKHETQYEIPLTQLSEILGLSKRIECIEAFDVSNLSGSFVVGSMIVFDGGWSKDQYRRYRIRGIQNQDDVGSIYEILSRRLKRALTEQQKLPDLILVDGGKPQINAALKAMLETEVQVPVAGMVKDKKHKTRGLILENGNEVDLKKYPQVFKLISEIQEEVHRFTIEYHKKLRTQQSIHSVLEEIPGIGKVRKKELLKHFGSIDTIKRATLEELMQVKGINNCLAKVIHDYFHKHDS